MKKADLSKFIKTQASLYSTAAINMIAATCVVVHQRGAEFDLSAFKKEVGAYLSESKAKRLAENANKACIVLQPVLDPLAKEASTPEQFFDAIRELFTARKWTSQNKLEQALFPERKPNTGSKKPAKTEQKPGPVQTLNPEQPSEAPAQAAAGPVAVANDAAPTTPAEVSKTETKTVDIKPVEPGEPDHQEDRVSLAMGIVAGMDETQLKEFTLRFAAFVEAARKAA